jgi:hypothetical protein
MHWIVQSFGPPIVSWYVLFAHALIIFLLLLLSYVFVLFVVINIFQQQSVKIKFELHFYLSPPLKSSNPSPPAHMSTLCSVPSSTLFQTFQGQPVPKRLESKVVDALGSSVFTMEAIQLGSHVDRTLVSVQNLHYLALYLFQTRKEDQLEELKFILSGACGLWYMHACVHVCTHICMYTCVCVCVCLCERTRVHGVCQCTVLPQP